MAAPVTDRAEKKHHGQRSEVRAAEPSRRLQTPANPYAYLLALHRTAGNRAVSRVLSSSGKPVEANLLKDASHSDAMTESPHVAGVASAVRALPSTDAGRPLDAATRSYMESRFRQDFGQVRVHTGVEATAAADAAGAAAYTIGSHVVINSREVPREARAHHYVLAHELAHVVQQRRGNAPPSLDPAGPLEQAAGDAARGVTHDQGPVTVNGASAPGLARMTIAEARGKLWSLVPEEAKPYVRPAAQAVSKRMDVWVPPQTSLPHSIERAVDETAKTVNAVKQAPMAKAAMPAAQAGSSASATPKPAAAAPGDKSSAKASTPSTKELSRFKTMETLGTLKGIVLEVSNAGDTLLWAQTLPERHALQWAAENGWINKERYGELLAQGKEIGLLDPMSASPGSAGLVSKGFDWVADKAESGLFGDMPPEQTVFTGYEMGELEGALGTQAVAAYFGAEEVQLALRIVGGIGGLRMLVTTIDRDKDWIKSPGFWQGFVMAALSVLGLLRTRASGKILQMVNVLILAGDFGECATAVWKLHHDYNDAELAAKPAAERHKVFADDIRNVVYAAVKVIKIAMAKGRAANTPEPRPGAPDQSQARGAPTAPEKVAPAGGDREAPSRPASSEPLQAPPSVAPEATSPFVTGSPSEGQVKVTPDVGSVAPRESMKPPPPKALPASPQAERPLAPAPRAKGMPSVTTEPKRTLPPASDDGPTRATAESKEPSSGGRTGRVSSANVKWVMNEARRGALATQEQQDHARWLLNAGLEEGGYSPQERATLRQQLEAMLAPPERTAQARPKAAGDYEDLAGAVDPQSRQEAPQDLATAGSPPPGRVIAIGTRSGGRGSSGTADVSVLPGRGGSGPRESIPPPRRGSSGGELRGRPPVAEGPQKAPPGGAGEPNRVFLDPETRKEALKIISQRTIKPDFKAKQGRFGEFATSETARKGRLPGVGQVDDVIPGQHDPGGHGADLFALKDGAPIGLEVKTKASADVKGFDERTGYRIGSQEKPTYKTTRQASPEGMRDDWAKWLAENPGKARRLANRGVLDPRWTDPEWVAKRGAAHFRQPGKRYVVVVSPTAESTVTPEAMASIDLPADQVIQIGVHEE